MERPSSYEDASPMTEIALELGEAKISSLKRRISYSPKTNKNNTDHIMSPSRAPLASVKNIMGTISNNTNNALLQSGLRVSTPPGRCGRRFLADENSPIFRSPSTYTVVIRQRNLLLEDTEGISHDSPDVPFRFLQPRGLAPRKTDSPRRCLKFSCENTTASSISSDSGISEDGFSELPDEDSLSLPSSFGCLIRTPIKSQQTTPKTRKRRSTPLSSGAKRSKPMIERSKTISDIKSLSDRLKPLSQRPKPLSDRASEENKSKKKTLFEYGFTKEVKPPVKKEEPVPNSDLSIKLALQRSTQEELIGDFSRPFALPLMSGKHQDLKTISSDTLAKLIKGEFNDTIASFKIIDCRYPYEYAGGHIRGAVNLYTCDHIQKDLLQMKKSQENNNEETSDDMRNILIFHCEFSSERGPFLSRFLRREDRAGHAYPNLSFPELYLLHGGYKAFFESHKELCEPQSYRTMQDPDHTVEYKHFRAKSKTWAPGSTRKLAVRSLSRLNF